MSRPLQGLSPYFGVTMSLYNNLHGNGTPTMYPNGINVSYDQATLAGLGVPDPTAVCQWWDDFTTGIDTTNDYSITKTQAGASIAITNVDGGAILITNTNTTAADLAQLQSLSACYTTANLLTSETQMKPALFFKARLKVSSIVDSKIYVGLQTAANADGSAPTNGIWFSATAGALKCNIAAASATSTTGTLATLTADTYFTCGFAYYPMGRPSAPAGILQIYYNDNPVDAASATTGSIALTNLPATSTVLAPIVGTKQTATTAGRTVTVDYMVAAKHRS